MQYTYQSATIDKSSQSSDTLCAYATPDNHNSGVAFRVLAAHRAHFPQGAPFEERAATPGDCGQGDGISPSELTHPGFNFRRPNDRTHPNHLGTHPNVDPLMPNRDLLIWAITGIWRMWRWH